MKISYTVLGVVFTLVFTLVSFSSLRAEESEETVSEVSEVEMILITPEDVAWAEVPPLLPPGAKIAVLEGDPHNSEPYTLRLMLPADYKIPAHWHTMPERVSVLSGTLYAGMGDKLDAEQSKAFEAGSFIFIPSKKNHFAWVKEDTIIQINGDGPFDITYIDPADDPRSASN